MQRLSRSFWDAHGSYLFSLCSMGYFSVIYLQTDYQKIENLGKVEKKI